MIWYTEGITEINFYLSKAWYISVNDMAGIMFQTKYVSSHAADVYVLNDV